MFETIPRRDCKRDKSGCLIFIREDHLQTPIVNRTLLHLKKKKNENCHITNIINGKKKYTNAKFSLHV